MGSNLQRILGVMTPDKVNTMVERASSGRLEVVKEIDTDTEAQMASGEEALKQTQEKRQESQQEEEHQDSEGSLAEIIQVTQTKKADDKQRETAKKPGRSQELSIIDFDYQHLQELAKKAEQKKAISLYKSNIVPNYLKGTSRKDLQGLLVNKKCG